MNEQPISLEQIRRRDRDWSNGEFDGILEHPDTQCAADLDRHVLLATAAPSLDAKALAENITIALVARKDSSGLSWNEAQTVGIDVARRVVANLDTVS